MPPGVVTDTNWQSGALILGFGLSIPVFFIITRAWVLWFVVPLLVGRVAGFSAGSSAPARSPDPYRGRTGAPSRERRTGTYASNARKALSPDGFCGTIRVNKSKSAIVCARGDWQGPGHTRSVVRERVTV